MNILMVMSKENREYEICKRISRYVMKDREDANVLIIKRFENRFIEKVIRFSPDIIMVYPFTGEGVSCIFTIFKYIFNCKIVCFTTEGSFDIEKPDAVDLFTGIDKYDLNLIDQEIFWGTKPAEVLGEELISQGKLKNSSQIYVSGYPLYEDYFNKSTECLEIKLYNIINKYPRERVFIFATGFHFADYDREEIINARDLVRTYDLQKEERIKNLVELTDKVKVYRENFINGVTLAAKQNRDCLFVIKMHPCEIERKYDNNPYDKLKELENVILIDYMINLSKFICNANIFFHIGSTTMIESYLANVNTCFLMDENLHSEENDNEPLFYGKFYWPSTYEIYLTELSEFINKSKKDVQKHIKNKMIEKVLFEFFNVNRKNLIGEEKYCPSKRIAQILLDNTEISKIDINSLFLKEAFSSFKNQFMYEYLNMLIECISLGNISGIEQVISRIKLINKINTLDLMQKNIENICNNYEEIIGTDTVGLRKQLKKYMAYYKLENDVFYSIYNCKDINIAIFGASKNGQEFYSYIEGYCNENRIKVNYFDNNSDLWGEKIDNCFVLQPDAAKLEKYDYIYICSQYNKEIYNQLIDYGLDKNKINKKIYRW